jgi:hypothetical protein
MIVDSFDMLVIDMASLCKGMYESGGFFGQLKQHVSRIKKRTRDAIVVPQGTVMIMGPHTQADIDRIQASSAEHFKSEIERNLLEALERLFPGYEQRKDRPLNHDDIEQLKQRFKQLHGKVIADRDANRAHKYQNEGKQADRLDLSALEFHFGELETLLNDLRFIILDSSFSYNDMNMADAKRTAGDIADIVFNRSINDFAQTLGINDALQAAGHQYPYYWKIRDDYYKNFKKPEGGQAEGPDADPG